jgi:fluoride exporter
MAINVLGSFVMGLLVELFAFKFGMSQQWRLFLTTGVVGGFTTFSTFSLEAALLWERGHVLQAFLYVSGSVVLGIGALFVALYLGRHLLGISDAL